MKMVESRFHLVTPVWGAGYVELYLNVALPALLSPGNLGGVPLGGALYTLYTTAVDAEQIRNSVAHNELAARLPTQFVLIDDLLHVTNWARLTERQAGYYAPMVATHRMAITAAGKDPTTCLLFIQPDSVFADGTLKFCVEAANQGKRAALVQTLRVEQLAFRTALESEIPVHNGVSKIVTPRQLVDLILRYPHPTVRGLWWNANFRQVAPTHMLFPVGESGLVSRGRHYHPLMVRPDGSPLMPAGAIDHDWLAQLGIGPQQVAVATDSDLGIGCEMSRAQQHIHCLEEGIAWTTRQMGFMFTDRRAGYFRLCLQYPAYLHRGDPVPESGLAYAKARAVVAEIRTWMILCWIFRVHDFHWAWLAVKVPVQRRFGQTKAYLFLKKLKMALIG